MIKDFRMTQLAIEIGPATDTEIAPLEGSVDLSSPVVGKIDDWALVALRNRDETTLHVVGGFGGRIRKTSTVVVISADRRAVRTLHSLYELGRPADGPVGALLAVILMGMHDARSAMASPFPDNSLECVGHG